PAESAQQTEQATALKAAKGECERAEKELALLRDSLFVRYPGYQLRQGFAPPTFEQLRQLSRRNPDTLYLEYAPPERAVTLLLAVHNGVLTTYRLPLGAKRLATLVSDWRQAILNRAANEPERARELYTTLLDPVQKKGSLQGVKRLVVVSNGSFLDTP